MALSRRGLRTRDDDSARRWVAGSELPGDAIGRPVMDPDVALDELLDLLDRIATLADMHPSATVADRDINRMLELVEGLDSWLTSGGFLPDRWQPASRSRP
jgi:hypothetical protein